MLNSVIDYVIDLFKFKRQCQIIGRTKKELMAVRMIMFAEIFCAMCAAEVPVASIITLIKATGRIHPNNTCSAMISRMVNVSAPPVNSSIVLKQSKIIIRKQASYPQF